MRAVKTTESLPWLGTVCHVVGERAAIVYCPKLDKEVLLKFKGPLGNKRNGTPFLLPSVVFFSSGAGAVSSASGRTPLGISPPADWGRGEEGMVPLYCSSTHISSFRDGSGSTSCSARSPRRPLPSRTHSPPQPAPPPMPPHDIPS